MCLLLVESLFFVYPSARSHLSESHSPALLRRVGRARVRHAATRVHRTAQQLRDSARHYSEEYRENQAAAIRRPPHTHGLNEERSTGSRVPLVCMRLQRNKSKVMKNRKMPINTFANKYQTQNWKPRQDKSCVNENEKNCENLPLRTRNKRNETNKCRIQILARKNMAIQQKKRRE
jgi:hypothetical protein